MDELQYEIDRLEDWSIAAYEALYVTGDVQALQNAIEELLANSLHKQDHTQDPKLINKRTHMQRYFHLGQLREMTNRARKHKAA